jgi:hypothetical protein
MEMADRDLETARKESREDVIHAKLIERLNA